MKIDWKQKLSSRKFWVALIAFITPLLVLSKIDGGTIENITTIIMSGLTLITYILTEGYVDANRE